MTRVLFLCSNNAVRSRMAEAFARARHPDGVEFLSAGIEAAPLHPLAVRVMSEINIPLDDSPARRISDLGPLDFGVVVSLCITASEKCPILPGQPITVDWNVPDPSAAGVAEPDALEAFRRTRDEIRLLVDGFLDRGYLAALTAAKDRANIILDNISDGIIAHDMQRHIFEFNRAAEKITGYSRSEVINRDCHDAFPGQFCGGKCSFCEDWEPKFDTMTKELQLRTRDGDTRNVHMTLRSMLNRAGETVGVLAAFRDRTREDNLARRLKQVHSFAGIIGRDPKMIEVFDMIRSVADANVPVLISGESGTGKELVAAAIHNESPRGTKQFVPVNCGALPESLLESELFGHVKGAFTGAIRDKKGRFELADGGTIFLDEIGDISPAMQVKLMRVLQEGTFERVGSETTVKVNVRVISATNKNIPDEIAARRFREDLYYRLSVVPIHLPPLRERRNDIPLIAAHCLNLALADRGRAGVALAPETLDVMLSYDWPGNIRELQNWIQFALVKCKGDVILPSHLPPPANVPHALPAVHRAKRLDTATVLDALKKTADNRVMAAKFLGVSRATLYRFLDGMKADAGRGSEPRA